MLLGCIARVDYIYKVGGIAKGDNYFQNRCGLFDELALGFNLVALGYFGDNAIVQQGHVLVTLAAFCLGYPGSVGEVVNLMRLVWPGLPF